MTRYLALAATFCIVVSAWHSPARAADQPQIPRLGYKAPDFTLNDLAGNPVTLSKLLAKSPVVLIVLRGYPGYQCPICSIQVGELLTHADALAEAKAYVLLVYPGPADELDQRAAEFMSKRTLPAHFSYVTDPDYAFTNAYGLRWDAPRETAYPSTFVIDGQGTIRLATVSKTHGGRAKAAEILKALPGAE